MLDNQTLQDKYPHLEVSVLKLSEVKKDNESFRIDSEPYKKSNMYFNSNFSYVKLSEIAIINPSKTEIQSFSKNTQITFLSMQNLGNGTINEREQGTILEFESGYTYFAEDDILIAKITPCMEHGKCAIATDLCNGIGFGSTEFNVFRIKDERFIKEFVFCYLNRESIRKIATDNMVGTSGRQRVPTSFYEKLLIPIFPMLFQLEIEKLVKDSHKALESSKALYKEAEALLYEALGLDSKNPLQSILHSNYESLPYRSKQNENFLNTESNQSPNYTIATLKESFLKTGRLDAEYYQSKYEDIERFIKNYKGGYGIVSDFFTQNKNICDFSKPYYNYIEIGDINTSNGNINYNKIATNELPANAKIMVRKGDILISKVRPYRGAIGIVNVEKDNLIASGAFVVLQEKGSIKKEFLQVLLRTSVYKEWVLRYNVGTSYPVIKDEDILNLPIPLFDSTTQAQIATYIQKSFELRAEAKSLLESAKFNV